MPSSCVVSNCEHKYTHSSNISFHKFPIRSPKLLDKWKRFTNRGPAWHPSRWSSICSRHFLHSDFRDHIARKYLKRSAVPSVTIKSVVDYASIQLDMNVNFDRVTEPIRSPTPPPPAEVQRPQDKICRLCANSTTEQPDESPLVDATTMMALAKCFPTIRMDTTDDLLPKRICNECAEKTQTFSEFLDHVAAVQSDLWQRFGGGDGGGDTDFGHLSNNVSKIDDVDRVMGPNKMVVASVAATKPLIIKQEPFLNVKQEFVDSTRSLSTAEPMTTTNATLTTTMADVAPNVISPLNLLPENDAFCVFCDAYFINNLELKNHIVKYHSDNSRDVPNSCEIMEIITLENAFINLADDNCADDEEEEAADDDHHQHHHHQQQQHHHHDPNDYIPLERVLKVEHLNDYELRNQILTSIRVEHSYALDAATNTPPGIIGNDGYHLLKQEPAALLLQPIDTSFQVYESSYFVDGGGATATMDNYENIGPSDEPQTDKKQCSLCSVQCKTIYHLLMHKKKFHNRITNGGNKRRRFSNTRISCGECSASFHSKLALNNHKRYMCTVRKGCTYKCRYCQLEFPKWIQMRTHTKLCPKRVVVSDEQQPQCVLVAAKVEPTSPQPSPQKLARSKWTAATLSKQLDNGRFACMLCNRSYGRRSNLYRHQSFHRPQSEWNEKCTGCDRLFDRPHDLRTHIRLQECCGGGGGAAAIKPANNKLAATSKSNFICSQCGLAVTTMAKLRHHEMVQHSGAKPFVCEQCGKRFRFRNNLYQHRLTHCSERKHKCTMCPKIFKRLAGLNQHVKGFHYNIRPHTCAVCHYSFALKADMMRCKHSFLLATKLNGTSSTNG